MMKVKVTNSTIECVESSMGSYEFSFNRLRLRMSDNELDHVHFNLLTCCLGSRNNEVPTSAIINNISTKSLATVYAVKNYLMGNCFK